MSENNIHATTAELTPEEAMIQQRDTPEAQKARSQFAGKVRERITLGARRQRFESRNVIKLEWQIDGEWYEQEIPVRSISADQEQEILSRNSLMDLDFPKIPQIPQTYTDADGVERTVLVDDDSKPEAIEKAMIMNRWATTVNYERLLYAMDTDLEHPTEDRIVWSSLNPNDYDLDEALEALSALDIPNRQLDKHVAYINNLSVKEAQKDASDFLDGPTPPSESPDTSTSDGPSRGRRRRGQRR